MGIDVDIPHARIADFCRNHGTSLATRLIRLLEPLAPRDASDTEPPADDLHVQLDEADEE